MAIALRDTGTANGTGTQWSIPKSVISGLADGDVVLIALHKDQNTTTISASTGTTGWSIVRARNWASGGRNHGGALVAKRITDAAGEPTNWQFESSTSDDWSATAIAFSGVDAAAMFDTSPEYVEGTSSSSNNPDAPDITTVTAGAMVVTFQINPGTQADISFVAPSTFTLGEGVKRTTSMAVSAYRSEASAGSKTYGNWQHTSSDTVSQLTWTVALKPAATTATAGTTSGTGLASSPSPRVRPAAGHAAATGAAQAPAMPVYAQAGHATADGWASQGEGAELDVDPATIEATAAAGAASAAVAVPIGHASATGAAGAPTPGAGAPAGIASFNATAEAHDATVEVVAPTVIAEHASATGAASDATPGLSLPAEHLAATAEASGIGASVAVSPSVASATGAAQTATATVPGVAGTAMVQGAAQAPSTSVKASAGHASASASADAVAIAMAVYPAAASAIAAAYPLQAAVVARAGIAQATGATYDIRPPFDWGGVRVYLNPAPAPSAVLGPAPSPSAVMGDT